MRLLEKCDPIFLLQEGGQVAEEVLREVALLRELVAAQGERIRRLEEQLSRMENGDV